jgi:hypothetical protein
MASLLTGAGVSEIKYSLWVMTVESYICLPSSLNIFSSTNKRPSSAHLPITDLPLPRYLFKIFLYLVKWYEDHKQNIKFLPTDSFILMNWLYSHSRLNTLFLFITHIFESLNEEQKCNM